MTVAAVLHRVNRLIADETSMMEYTDPKSHPTYQDGYSDGYVKALAEVRAFILGLQHKDDEHAH